MALLGLTLILLLVLLALLIPVGRYAQKVGLAPRFWIMVNMVCWAGCWVIFRYILFPLFIKFTTWPAWSGIVVTLILCLISYALVWFIIRKRGNKNLESRINEIGKKL